MQCTSCNNGELVSSTLDGSLICHTCSSCHGNWIKLNDYIDWHNTQQPTQAVVDEIGVEVDTVESSKALLCPETGSIMTKFRISSDTDHRLDWSNSAGAIWLDNGEWNLLKEKGVADKLNQIFSHEWQEKIVEQTARNTREARLVEKLGEDNYSRLKLVRTWLHEQSDEDKAIMISFLVSRDPFASKD